MRETSAACGTGSSFSGGRSVFACYREQREENGEKRRIKRERDERIRPAYAYVCALEHHVKGTRVYRSHKHQHVRALIASSELVGINWSGQLTLTA